ncbi:MAG TPA: hypothetical protein VMG58_04155 [Candidatus Sulfotelmatobacter sp.]|nr:hypothetical protein [Candidatus Sulfotelmatobacter sp.]
MPTIVEYTDRKRAANRYPRRIVSPPHSSPCCFTTMEEVGQEEQEGRWVYRYRRCTTCGYTVRLIVRQLPDEELIAVLRKVLATSFVRNPPDF